MSEKNTQHLLAKKANLDDEKRVSVFKDKNGNVFLFALKQRVESLSTSQKFNNREVGASTRGDGKSEDQQPVSDSARVGYIS